MNRVSIVVPVYNEEENVPIVQREIFEALRDLDYELIFVDDGSQDGSLEIISGAFPRDYGEAYD